MTRQFWMLLVAEALSALGSSVTALAVPLLVLRLTGSPLALGASAALSTLPYILFGLHLGAWADRIDRRHMLIGADLLSAAAVAALPVSALAGVLTVQFVFAVVFIQGALAIAISAARFGVVPVLVSREELTRANGLLHSSVALASILGPLLVAALLSLVPLELVLFVDVATFLIGAIAIHSVRFPSQARAKASNVTSEAVQGLMYVLRDPILVTIAAMMALVNFIRAPAGAFVVLLAKDRYGATDPEVALLFTAAAIGALAFSLLAGKIRRRRSFGETALGALALSGLLYLGVGLAPDYWIAVCCWGVSSGLGVLFNVTTASLRQTLVPEELLGRVFTVAFVLSVWTSPLGSLLAGAVLERVDSVAFMYACIGLLAVIVPLGFWRYSPLRWVS